MYSLYLKSYIFMLSIVFLLLEIVNETIRIFGTYENFIEVLKTCKTTGSAQKNVFSGYSGQLLQTFREPIFNSLQSVISVWWKHELMRCKDCKITTWPPCETLSLLFYFIAVTNEPLKLSIEFDTEKGRCWTASMEQETRQQPLLGNSFVNI
jgi:hypothetical protein